MSADMDSCSRGPGAGVLATEVQKAQPVQGNLLDVHLQGAEAGAPQIGISSRAMSIMNLFVNDVLERLAGEGSGLAPTRLNQTHVLGVQRAVHLWLLGEPAKRAMSEVPRL